MKGKMVKGMASRTPKGFHENMEHMEKEGYGKKRAIGTAYGEAHDSMKCNRELKKLYASMK